MDDEGNKDTTEETGDTEDKDNVGTENFQSKWNLIHLVDIVSDVMKMDWHRVYDLNIVEFINTVCYYNDRTAYLNEQNKLWKQRN